MASTIRVISTSTVCAATHKEPHVKIHLTPWDLRVLFMDTLQRGLVFHKPKPDDPHQVTLIQKLQKSLSRTLDFFFPLAGRLATIEHDDETVSIFVDCNNAGAEFVHAVADGVSVSDIIEQTYVPDHVVISFFPLNGKSRNYDGTSKPLLTVQVTELVDGIFIGCTINHAVLDGTSFWHFFNSWSEFSRGFDSLSKPPVLERWFLPDTDSPIRIPFFKKEQLHGTLIPPPLKQRVFHFTAESIAKLKAKANAEIGTHKISSLQALLSHLWRSAVRNKQLDPDQETIFRILIGVRSRLQPPLPEQYLGNAVQGENITMKAGEVLEQGLGYVALQMNETIAMNTEEKLRNHLESWRENPEMRTILGLPSNFFLLGGSPRHNVYGNDFGWGRPIAVRRGPENKFDGMITIYPGAEEGSVDIEACLSPETLQGMGNDAEFMDAITDL